MRADNLWGKHLNASPWLEGVTESWREAGLSSCHFELPECRKLTIMGWSQMDIGQHDIEARRGHDGHYNFPIFRVTVKTSG